MIPKNFQAHVAAPLVCVRVISQDRNSYRVANADFETRAELLGRFLYTCSSAEDYPVVGDFVSLSLKEGSAVIESILPRKNLFSRRGIDGSYEMQPIAANLDTLFIVMAVNRDFNLRRLERYLVASSSLKIPTAIVLNKIDLAEDPDSFIAEVHEVANFTPVLAVSAETGVGLEGLRRYCGENLSIAFVGSSGVGKSTLINALLTDAKLEVGAIRAADDRGRHTTTRRSIFYLKDGTAIVDTPGMREFALADASVGLDATFAELSDLAQACRFRDCTHKAEPGCAVLENMDDERLQSYRKLEREAAFEARRSDRNLAAAERAKWKSIAKANRKRLRG